jgi:hypothetical protein
MDLYWAERSKKTPKNIRVTKDFQEWCTTQETAHPLLAALESSLPYDDSIEWPVTKTH